MSHTFVWSLWWAELRSPTLEFTSFQSLWSGFTSTFQIHAQNIFFRTAYSIYIYFFKCIDLILNCVHFINKSCYSLCCLLALCLVRCPWVPRKVPINEMYQQKRKKSQKILSQTFSSLLFSLSDCLALSLSVSHSLFFLFFFSLPLFFIFLSLFLTLSHSLSFLSLSLKFVLNMTEI